MLADMTGPKPKRRWYQYSLRTLMVFVTLCITNLKHRESFHKDSHRVAVTPYLSVAYNDDFERSVFVAAERSEAALGCTRYSILTSNTGLENDPHQSPFSAWPTPPL